MSKLPFLSSESENSLIRTPKTQLEDCHIAVGLQSSRSGSRSMLKAGDSICVEMVSAHKESADVVALLCCCLRYLKIQEYRPYPSVPVLVCAPGFARENKKNFFSLRLPCLFDRSIYPHHHPHNDFFSVSRSRDLRWRLNSRSLRQII